MWKGLLSFCLSYAVLASNTNLSSGLIIRHLSQSLHLLLGSRSERKETHTIHSIRFTFFFGVAIFTHYDPFKSKVFYNAFSNVHCASTGFTEINCTEEKTPNIYQDQIFLVQEPVFTFTIFQSSHRSLPFQLGC